MDFKTSLMGLITLAALSAAAFFYFKPNAIPPKRLNPTPLASVETTHLSSAPSPSTATITATPLTTRTPSERDGLSVPNTIETIEAGSSLFSIAQSHDIALNELTSVNNLSDPNKVIVGQTIIIPDNVSEDASVILFILNPNRLKKEEAKIAAGGTSLYVDPVSAVQSDAKGLYNVKADTPFSQSAQTNTTTTLSTTDANRIITCTMEKTSTGLWFVKKLISKPVKPTSQ